MEQTPPDESEMEQPDNFVTPTLFESITYDLAKLRKMTVSELLVQQLARQDLHFPHREKSLDAQKFKQEVVASVVEFIEKLNEVPLPTLAAELMQITEKYLDGFQ